MERKALKNIVKTERERKTLHTMCEICSLHIQCNGISAVTSVSFQQIDITHQHTHNSNSTLMTPPVAWMRCDRRVAMVTDWGRGLTTCFLLPADSEEEEVEEEDGVRKGDGEAMGHLTPLTISGRSKS